MREIKLNSEKFKTRNKQLDEEHWKIHDERQFIKRLEVRFCHLCNGVGKVEHETYGLQYMVLKTTIKKCHYCNGYGLICEKCNRPQNECSCGNYVDEHKHKYPHLYSQKTNTVEMVGVKTNAVWDGKNWKIYQLEEETKWKITI